MSKKLYEENNIQDIASAIREKNGSQNVYTVAQMGNAVRAIYTQPSLETLNATENGNYLPSVGKDGFSEVNVAVPGCTPNLQSKTVTPSALQQTIQPDSGYDGLSSVVVNGDVDLVAGNIKKNVDIFGVTGTYDGSGGGGGGDGNGNTILHETAYQRSGSFAYSKEIIIYKTSTYKISVQCSSDDFSIKINGVTQPRTLVVNDYHVYLYYSELNMNAGDVIVISCASSSGAITITSIITDINGSGSDAVIHPLSVTQNGTYNLTSGVDGYAPVTVNVSSDIAAYQKIMTQGMVSSTSRYETAYYDSGIDASQYDLLKINLWKNGNVIASGILAPVKSDQYITGTDGISYRFDTAATYISCTRYSGSYFNLYVDVYGISLSDEA